MAETAFAPGYLALWRSGELERRVAEAYRRLESCEGCPRHCHVNRLRGAQGAACHTGERARVASYGPHYGEEAPLVGRHGSGTIFFAWCNLRCVYCQNYEISQLGEGQEAGSRELATIMLRLQSMGCHNINLVSPSHVVPQILGALLLAAEDGLRLPLVYNSGGYDDLDTLRLLDGIVDIYMPDMKYADAETGWQLSSAKGYPAINQGAAREMYRQVGDLVMDAHAVAQRGLLIRHLVLPENLAGTAEIMRFVAEHISSNTYINIMDQYRPCYHAGDFAKLNRRISRQEYERAIQAAEQVGLTRLDGQTPRAHPASF
jgi:putative pyruvate formate lyase activating enzyme